MSHSTERGFLRRLDTLAALLGLLAAVALFPLRFVASQVYIQTIPVVLGVACLLYLLSAARGGEASAHARLSTGVSRALPSVAITATAGIVALTVGSGGRTPAVYALTGVAGVLVLLQVLFAREEDLQVGLVLLQVVLLAAAVRLPVLAVSPGFVGIDVWTHVPDLSRRIAAADSLGAISENKYYAAPLYHLLVVAAAGLFDVSLRTALHLSVGVVGTLAPLLVYALAALFVGSRWALLAAATYAVADYVIEWGIHLIPTSLGLLFFLAVVFLLVRVVRLPFRARDYAVLVVATVAVVLTHQVSSFITLVVIGAALVADAATSSGVVEDAGPTPPGGSDRRVSVALAALFAFDVVLITVMWSLTPYHGDSFLETTLSFFRETLSEQAGLLNLAGGAGGAGGSAAGAGSPLVTTLPTYLDVLGFLFLLGATVVGGLYAIRRRRVERSTLLLLVATGVMLVFVLGLPLFGIRNFIPQRWFAFLYVPLVVLGAVGLRCLARSRPRPLFVAVLLVFGLAYPGAMAVSHHGAIDDPVFDQQQTRQSYTEQELAAVSAVGAMTGSPSEDAVAESRLLYTDHPYETVLSRTGAYPAATFVAPPGEPITHPFVLYRTYQSDGASRFATGTDAAYPRNVARGDVCRPGMAVLYANGDVTLCKDPEAW